jgi:hypothetical protein
MMTFAAVGVTAWTSAKEPDVSLACLTLDMMMLLPRLALVSKCWMVLAEVEAVVGEEVKELVLVVENPKEEVRTPTEASEV